MKKLILLFLLFPVIHCYAWDGYDYENSTYVEIEQGNLVRQGRDIEVYDYDKGEYKDYEVENIRRYGNTVEVEVYDYENDEYRTFEMDDY